ncbi:hypothetical protein FGIG_07037 [Fasciola gigantica]|uniref:FERM domain-containing protein n=1 Tax=Fasciola gigantica TaxID=46835 RepID=A0A504Z292_FASGI|nr:hypothetical protein FGIG_07037 [Fasciola gigantica]
MPPANKKNEPVRDSTINVTVGFLDEHVESFKVPGRCLGQRLYDLVIGKLGSFEYQYFDLAFLDVEGNHFIFQLFDSKVSMHTFCETQNKVQRLFKVLVFFENRTSLTRTTQNYTYPLAPYLFALQLKRDFFNGLLHSNRNTSLLLAAFIVQSELGDYMETECKSYAYLKKHHLLRSAPDSYLMRVMELHQTLVGLTKEEADYRLLDAARKVELYGVRLHPVKNYLRDTVEYTFPTRNSCKNFWRKCIEQHAFFRSVTSLFPVNGSTGRSVGLLDSFRSGSLSSVRRLRRSASCGATEQTDSLHSSVSRTSDRPTSSGQASQMSTPVRRFARIRQHTASLKLFNKQQKRILDELQSPCLLSETKPAWALPEHPYTLPKQSIPGCKPVGVVKLLSNCPNPTAEYFQLLRLSFTSLIPESVSALDSGHTTPAASSRMRTLERMRERAVSTPSIHQPDVPKRKRSCHAFVPRQFNPLGSGTLPGARLKSQTSDDTLDLSASRTFPKRPNLDEVANCLQQRDKIGGNHIANGTSPPSLTASTEVNSIYRVNGYHLHRTPSSSCSLASDMSPTPLSENETTLNDIRGFVSPRDPRSSWLDGCGENEDAWSVSSREPILSNLVSSGVNDSTNKGLLT